MYTSADVEAHVRGRLWGITVEIADALCVARNSRVLDFGCGDGAFANQVLSAHYRVVEGLDKSENAIRRAQAEAQPNANYRAADLVMLDYNSLPTYDAAFLIGILHHVKAATPTLVRALARRTGKMIVLEPNGNHLMRKALELTPSYRAAGEDSFRSKELMRIFRLHRLADDNLATAQSVSKLHTRRDLLPSGANRAMDRNAPLLERPVHRRSLRSHCNQVTAKSGET